MYKVSILVPIYNVEKYIAKCAQSIFEQSYPDLEFIFVDDCSPDNSIGILSEIIGNYHHLANNVRIIHHSRNRGLAAARNTAVENAKGDFVMHVDSDDWLEPNAVQTLVSSQLATDADIVTGNAQQHFNDYVVEMQEPNYSSKEEMILSIIKPTLNHVIWRRLIRRSLYTNNGISAKEGCNLGEDWQVLPQLVYYANIINQVNSIVYHYNCTNEDSFMFKKNKVLDVNRCLQDLESISVVRKFFQDKDILYYREACRVEAIYLYKYMMRAAKCKNKRLFCILQNRMCQLRTTDMSVWRIFLMRHYNLMRLYSECRA